MTKLTKNHRKYIYKQIAEFATIASVHRDLADVDKAKENDFEPITLIYNTLYIFTQSNNSQRIIHELREIYLGKINDILFADKRSRIKELTKIINNPDTAIKDKIAALKAIKDEVGEDKYLEAIGKSGTTTTNINIQDELLKRLFTDDAS